MAQTFEARAPVNFSIVSQRRVYAPGGLKGGEDGAVGRNTIYRKVENGYIPINVSSNGMAKLAKGDRVQIATPGGGGWGKVGSSDI
jgi:5-oxoprolinase (ATP-hydrolysing)